MNFEQTNNEWIVKVTLSQEEKRTLKYAISILQELRQMKNIKLFDSMGNGIDDWYEDCACSVTESMLSSLIESMEYVANGQVTETETVKWG